MHAPGPHIEPSIFAVDSGSFDKLALEIFSYQYQNNQLYQQYCKMLNVEPNSVLAISNIPFLPIQFFKTQMVTCGSFTAQAIFESSGTSGATSSKHFIKDLALYEKSFVTAFHQCYGDVEQYSIMALLPSYMERGNSSLVYMVDALIKNAARPFSGFYLNNDDRLLRNLMDNERQGKKTFLIGVTYALLDLAEKNKMQLRHTIVMETGGMKGRRKEMTRDEVHKVLKQRLGIHEVHSEYGMTELLSQAYAKKDGVFECPGWMKVLLRAEDDPFEIKSSYMLQTDVVAGALNIIDLANMHSCAFIATDDIGRLHQNGRFEVLGRLDNSDIRGCGLMIL